MSDSQNLTNQNEDLPQENNKFIKSFFKVLGHSFVLLFGYLIFFVYFIILMMYSFFHVHNYIFFIPQLMVILIPLVLIIIGAVNSYSVSYVFHRKIDDSWSSLLLQGIFMILIGLLFAVVWINVIGFLGGPRWPPFYLNFGPFFIAFYLLLIPSTGYASKVVTIFLFTRKKVQRTKDSENLSQFEA